MRQQEQLPPCFEFQNFTDVLFYDNKICKNTDQTNRVNPQQGGISDTYKWRRLAIAAEFFDNQSNSSGAMPEFCWTKKMEFYK